METTITSADICELAHYYTELECAEKGIVCNTIRDDETVYANEAEDIFNRHYDKMCELLGHNNK